MKLTRVKNFLQNSFLFLTLILLTWRIWRASNNASKWQMGFNAAFKGLTMKISLDTSSNMKGAQHYL
jgi:hypothetical protein